MFFLFLMMIILSLQIFVFGYLLVHGSPDLSQFIPAAARELNQES